MSSELAPRVKARSAPQKSPDGGRTRCSDELGGGSAHGVPWAFSQSVRLFVSTRIRGFTAGARFVECEFHFLGRIASACPSHREELLRGLDCTLGATSRANLQDEFCGRKRRASGVIGSAKHAFDLTAIGCIRGGQPTPDAPRRALAGEIA